MTSAHKNVTPVEDGARIDHAEKKMHSNSNERGKKEAAKMLQKT